MTKEPLTLRERLVLHAKERLQRTHSPRTMMTLILMVAASGGFIASAVMLYFGVESMPLRYPLAVLASYLVFLIMLWFWLRTQSLHSEAVVVAALAVGAEEALAPNAERKQPASAGRWAGDGGSWGNGLGGSGDEGIVFLLILAALASALVVCIYIIAIAPALLAELMVDGVVVAALAKTIGPVNAEHWLWNVISRTWIPVLILGVVFWLVGLGLEKVVPGAHSMGQAWRMSRH